MELIKGVILDTCLDCLKMLPFLFVAFLVIEALEHYSSEYVEKLLKKVGKAGPAAAAVAGCVPQCGFSVMAANLYAGGTISIGTLIAVFMATSDEAVLIILSNPDRIAEVGKLILVKLLTAVVAGYFTDFFLRNRIEVRKSHGVLCDHCGCHDEKGSILLPAWRHTFNLFLYLLAFTGVLNLCIELLGMERLSALLLGNTIMQPVIAAVIGFIPNCASSVLLTQLYLNGAISFASVIAGLSTATGAGLLVLCKTNRNRKENIKIAGVLFVLAILSGIVLELVMPGGIML